MAITVETPSSHADVVRHGLVVRITPLRGATELDYAAADGIATVRIEAAVAPGPRTPVRLPMRRVANVRIDVDDDGVRCTARGIGHRVPRSYPVDPPTALALARAGVPTIVVERAVS